MAFTPGKDFNILQTTDLSNVDAGFGDDVYIVTAATLENGKKIQIVDDKGNNSLQLVGGLEIASSIVASDTVQLTLSNGSEITVTGASSFGFEPGGNITAGIDNEDVDYATFATETLGVDSVPDVGAEPVDGGAVTIEGGSGGDDIDPPVFESAEVNGDTLTLTYGEALNAENAPTVDDFTVTPLVDQEVLDEAGNQTFDDEGNLVIESVPGDPITVADLSVDGTTVILTLETPVTEGQEITVSYDPALDGEDATAIQDVAGNDAESLDNQEVTNNTTTVENAAPVITSESAVNVEENQTVVTTVVATDTDADDTLTYTIAGGDDEALFALDATTGELSFVAAPDFEALASAADNNDYLVTVAVSDGVNDVTQDLTVTVTDVEVENAAPIAEADTATTDVDTAVTIAVLVNDSDPEADALTIAGVTSTIGATVEIVDLEDGTQGVSYTPAAGFVGTDTFTYDINDGNGNTVTGTVSVEVTEPVVPEDTTPPLFTSAATAGAIENRNVLYTAGATDDTTPITFSLTGADAALLAIDAASGVVTLIDGALDFDAGVKTSYAFDVVATDSATALNSATLAVTVTVTDDVTDNPIPDTTAPVFTSAATANADENQNVLYTAGATDDTAPITFSLAGADAALLAIDAASGVVTLAAGNLDFDAGVKTYAFDVIATDGATPANASAPLAVTVTVTDDVTDNGPTVENVTAGNTTPIDAAADEFDFVFAAGTYTYNITGFGTDDVLDLPDAFFGTATITNASGTDGNMTIKGDDGAANVITINLTGLATELDTAFNVITFNSAFGEGSLI